MATIAENLQSLVTVKNDIATAITNKGVILPENAGFLNFASAIENIETEGQRIEGTITSIVANQSHFYNINVILACRIGKSIFIHASQGHNGDYITDRIRENPIFRVSGLDFPTSKNDIDFTVGKFRIDAMKSNYDSLDFYSDFDWDRHVYNVTEQYVDFIPFRNPPSYGLYGGPCEISFAFVLK